MILHRSAHTQKSTRTIAIGAGLLTPSKPTTDGLLFSLIAFHYD